MTDSIKNSTTNTKNGRYVLGGKTETSLFALEWWNKVNVQRDPSDIMYVMEKKYEGRPDLLGFVFYGDTGLWWIICQYNGILNPIDELIEGKILLVPTFDRIKKEFTAGVPGGIPSTREKK